MARLIVEKSVARPVKDMVKATEKVSIGDFSQRLDLERNDEIGRLAQSFNIMNDQLGLLFASIKNAVTEMSASSKLIVHRTGDRGGKSHGSKGIHKGNKAQCQDTQSNEPTVGFPGKSIQDTIGTGRIWHIGPGRNISF